MGNAPTPALLGIDWGTSNRRACWLDAHGELLFEHADDQGCFAVAGRFEATLETLVALGPPLPRGTPVLMSGAVGGVGGWQEVPYVGAETPLAELPSHLVPVAGTRQRALIVPGVRCDAADGGVDVMRGEETQLLGALALGHGDGWFVLPGTHGKWVRLAGGRVTELATYLSGELFALLTQHGTLAALTAEGDESPAAFRAGVDAAGRSALSHALFACRARVVTGRMPARDAREHLSGLLIGAEWHDARLRHGALPPSVTLIGAPALVRRHLDAAAAFGCAATALEPRAVQLAALRVLGAAL